MGAEGGIEEGGCGAEVDEWGIEVGGYGDGIVVPFVVARVYGCRRVQGGLEDELYPTVHCGVTMVFRRSDSGGAGGEIDECVWWLVGEQETTA